MSLTIPFTSRREKRRKHRADDRIAELKVKHAAELARLRDEMVLLRDDNTRLLNRQAAADDYFAILWNDVLVSNQALVYKEELRQEAEVAASQMRMQRDEHAATIQRIDELHAQTVEALEAQLTEANRRLGIACQANAAADQTQEIDVSALRAATQVIPLHQAGAAGLLGPVTDPGQHATR